MFAGPDDGPLPALLIQVVGQKIIVYWEMCSMIVGGLSMAKYIKQIE